MNWGTVPRLHNCSCFCKLLGFLPVVVCRHSCSNRQDYISLMIVAVVADFSLMIHRVKIAALWFPNVAAVLSPSARQLEPSHARITRNGKDNQLLALVTITPPLRELILSVHSWLLDADVHQFDLAMIETYLATRLRTW